MSAITVNVNRIDPSQPRPATQPLDLEADLSRVRQLAQLMDAQFEIAGIKIGWDAIIGLVPVIGDLATAVVGAYPIYIARKHKLGKWVQFRMAGNVLIDWAVGEIPILGDLFDVGFKSNIKNAALLERAAARTREK
jgi:hypothetical protein